MTEDSGQMTEIRIIYDERQGCCKAGKLGCREAGRLVFVAAFALEG
jgi:hypothetical protein